MRIRTRAGRLVICAALLLSCHESTGTATPVTPVAAVRRRAVLVGIDDYSATRIHRQSTLHPSLDRAWPTLRGAARDVDLLREMLIVRYGFEPAGIVTLKNQQATREAILHAIQGHLIELAAKNDVLLFYFAGHGSRVPNSLSSELDKLDESIVPADSRLGAPDIRDKELAVLFNRILDRGARLTVVFDSCYSGSVSRALAADADVRAISADTGDVRDALEPPAPETRGALVMTASKDFARAFEVTDEEGNHHGVFSWALLKAMRASGREEAAIDTFLRAQAMMRAESPYQDPVIAGDAAARLTPLLSSDATRSPVHDTVAVERVNPDGTVILQGGWAHGLTVGTELRPRERAAAVTRIRITNMLGLGRSEGRIVGANRALATVSAGSLLEVATWSAPPGRPLRVWMPQAGDIDALLATARRLRSEVARTSVQWVDDPTAVTPTHLLRWRGQEWELVGPRGVSERIERNAAAPSILAKLPRKASLFVQLPAPAALAEAIGVGPGTDYDNVTPANDPRGVDYVLVGHVAAKSVEYSWMRPAVHKQDERDTPLPPRSDWESAEPAREAAIALRYTILRLHKILAWHHLESPPDLKSPYRLTLEDAESHTVVRDGTVTGRRRYRLVLRALDPSVTHVDSRYYYVFGIDSFGKSVLLFPPRGSVENHFPIEPVGTPPAREIPIRVMKVTEPYGLDTYFLLSTDESLPNPSVVEWAGVRTRGPNGATGLEELLSRMGGATRSVDAVDVSPIWSIDKLLIHSVPPAGISARDRRRRGRSSHSLGAVR